MGLFSQASSKPIKMYMDLLSQPCRALDIFFRINKIPYEPINVNLGKMEHLRDDFEKLNPFKKVPVIDHDGFILTESVAIFRHVCRNYKIEDKWYPRDGTKRAYVDEYIEWQHTALRAPCALYVWLVAITPSMTGVEPPPRQTQSRKDSMTKACDDLNDIWLKRKPYVAGQEISFADLLAACEIQQLLWTDYDPREGRPELSQWLDRVRKETSPYFDQAHAKIVKVAERRKTAAKAKLQ